MSRLLVHFHIYYHDQVEFFIEKMRNIVGCEWDLIVTYSEGSEQTESLIKEFKPEAEFLQVENAGYDVWPFIKVLKTVDFDRYDYILKLHTKNVSPTKNRINGLALKNDRWRNILVDSMLADSERFTKCLNPSDSDEFCSLLTVFLLVNRQWTPLRMLSLKSL